MGATTIWERWDGQKTDSTFQDPGMNSFNHYAYGAIGDWMYRVVAGLETETPGYRHLRIQPQPGEHLSYAKASFESPYGTVMSGWKKTDAGKTEFTVRIPSNADATIVLPVSDINKVTESGKPVSGNPGFSSVRVTDGRISFKAGSGEYHFIVN